MSELRGRLIRFTEESLDHARIGNVDLFQVENSLKALRGMQKALVDPALIDAKIKSDKALKAEVAKNKKLAAEIGDPWGDIAKAQMAHRELAVRHAFMEGAWFSDLFSHGRALLRAAEEREKPNGDRLPEYTESRLPLLQKRVLDDAPVYPELEQLRLEFWLSKLRENLPADAPGTKIFLGKDSPETLSARLSKSRLANPAYRKQLWDGGLAAIKASDDPMIRFVLATDAASRAIRKEYEDRVTGPTDRAAENIARARFAIYGTSAYPDATFSARISYGKVQGWTDNGVEAGPFTRFAGLYDRATGQPPFALSDKWIAAQSELDPDTVFNFVTNNDVVGGNSGSPAINAKGDVIGAVFDGNIGSLGGSFGFDDRVNRSVIVSTAAITEALQKVYGNEALVSELTGK